MVVFATAICQSQKIISQRPKLQIPEILLKEPFLPNFICRILTTQSLEKSKFHRPSHSMPLLDNNSAAGPERLRRNGPSLTFSFQAREKSTQINLLGPENAGWGLLFHAKGWWSKSECPPSKVCLPWDVPGVLPGCPGAVKALKKFVQKSLC